VGTFAASCVGCRPKTGILKKEALCSSEALILADRASRRYIAEGCSLEEDEWEHSRSFDVLSAEGPWLGAVRITTTHLPCLLALPYTRDHCVACQLESYIPIT